MTAATLSLEQALVRLHESEECLPVLSDKRPQRPSLFVIVCLRRTAILVRLKYPAHVSCRMSYERGGLAVIIRYPTLTHDRLLAREYDFTPNIISVLRG